MKRILTFLLIGGMVVTSVISFSGCNGNSDKELKSVVEEALETKYAEEFECINFWSVGKDYYCGVCYPKDEPDLLFETLFYSDGDINADDYASSIISKMFIKEFDSQIKDIFNEHYTYCYNYGDLHDSKTAQIISNGNFTLDYYFPEMSKKYDNNELKLFFRICIPNSDNTDISYEEEYDIILNAFNTIHEIGEKYDVNLLFRLNMYFLSNQNYDDCKEYFENNATIKSDFDKITNEDNSLIKFDYENSVCTISKEEYCDKREGIL